MGNKISDNINYRAIVGTFQYGDGPNTSFAGAEARYSKNSNYVGVGAHIATDNFENAYGLVDFKGKLKYDKKGIFEQNLRIRTAFDKELKTTQIRFSPFTVNIPITENISIYNNLNYAAKHNWQTKDWAHSASDFLGLSFNATKNLNIAVEGQAYNIHNPQNITSKDFSANVFITWKF